VVGVETHVYNPKRQVPTTIPQNTPTHHHPPKYSCKSRGEGRRSPSWYHRYLQR